MGTYTKGEMGIDLTNTPHVPYPLDFSGFNFTVKEIIIGSYMNAFLTKNGELYSIGNNDYGKFGDGTVGAFVNTVPSRFNISKPIVKAATGTCHMLVLTADGEVYGSGCNFYNVLSAETSSSFPSPILIFNSSYNIIDIETNWYLTIAISSTGEIYTLGENNGHPETGNNLLAKVTQGLEGKFIKRVVGSSTYSIVETFTKEFYIFGKLSANTFVKPTLIESLSGSNWMNFTDIKTTSNSFLCLTNASTVYSVSYGGQGFVLNFVRNKVKVIVHDRLLTSDNILMLRDSSTEQYLSLKHLRPNTEIVKMLKDPKHNNPITYYYANDGTFYFSINYESGNMNGNAGSTFGFSPLNITSSYVNINPFNLNYVKPSKGSAYTVFLNSVDNTIFTTGLNVNGALGDGTTKDTLSPITFTMDLLKDKEIIDISVGHYHTLILTKDREVYAFGSNLRKQFCQSTYATANQLMKLSLSNVVAISAGLDFSLFVIASPEGNRVYACGYSTNGETGIGATQDLANSYIDFFNNTNITSVVGANGYSFFLAGNGTAYALGGNLYNRFGNNDFNYQIYTSPVQITGINDKIVKISSANEISLFLTDKGEVYYTKTNVKNTVKLDGLVGEQIVDIGTGSNYGLMLTNNGKLFGLFSGDFNSYFGQLGMLNPGKYSLQRIPLFHKVKRMEVGLYHSFLAVSKVETFCEGLSNCSYNGICVGNNVCKCNDGWFGDNCTLFYCTGECSGHGNCTGPNQCKCDSGWKGNSNCSINSCENSSNCNNGNGTCIGPNQCKCNNGWEGDSCNVFNCNQTGFCNGNGTCIGPNTCSCNSGYKGSPYCNVTSCESVGNCSSNGLCIGPNTCSCFEGWTGSNCSIPLCFNIPANETNNVCNYGNGTCISPDKCQCNSKWGGVTCQIPKCYGILANETSKVCNNGNGTCTGVNTCECFTGYTGLSCGWFSCKEVNNCSGHGYCIGPNQCDCQPEWNVYKNCSERMITNNCDSLNNCYGNGQCIGANQCKCFDGYQSFDCKYKSLSSDSIVISGKSEGTEKISTFSFTINVKNNTVDTSQIIYNYFIENIFNQTTNSSTIDFTMKSKGSYNLIVTLFVKERQDFIYGKQFKTITVNELKEDTITNLNINDIYEITKNNDIYNNENKSTIINQIVTTTQKEIVQTKDQGDKILDIYKSVVKTNNDIPISVNITLQVNQISNLYLTMKQNDNITDTQIDSSVQSIVLILDNILQQTNSSSNITNISKDDLKRDTENTLQTTFSLLSLSKSIEEKRIEGNAINLVFKRRTTTTNGNTNLNITTEYQFSIPTDLNLETSNNDISFGAIKIGDSQLYQTNNEMNSLSNVIQLKTFVNGSYTPLKNLKQSIIISFKLESKGINSFNSTTSYSCRYFNENSKQWLSDGCKPVGAVTLNNGIIVMNCECDHTTSFLTFLESNSKSNNTSIAQLVLSSIYLLIIILIFILLIIFRKDPIVKSRYITPFIGLTAIFIDSLFSGIIANAIFQQTKIFNTLSSITITTSNASDIVGNVAIIISSMMTLIAIACYFIESFRYLIIRYLYEILNNNLKDNNDTNQLLNSNIEKKPVLKILSSKLIYVISAFN